MVHTIIMHCLSMINNYSSVFWSCMIKNKKDVENAVFIPLFTGRLQEGTLLSDDCADVVFCIFLYTLSGWNR